MPPGFFVEHGGACDGLWAKSAVVVAQQCFCFCPKYAWNQAVLDNAGLGEAANRIKGNANDRLAASVNVADKRNQGDCMLRKVDHRVAEFSAQVDAELTNLCDAHKSNS